MTKTLLEIEMIVVEEQHSTSHRTHCIRESIIVQNEKWRKQIVAVICLFVSPFSVMYEKCQSDPQVLLYSDHHFYPQYQI